MVDEKDSGISDAELLHMASDIAAAYVSHNNLSAEQLPDVIKTVHATLSSVGRGLGSDRDNLKPAVPVRRSITPDYIVCLEDGKRLKMLKRHLRSAYNMTPDEYRAKWGLPSDYPMVAPNYAKQRSQFAKKIGLGRKGKGEGRAKKA
ncbi:MAG: transcriptional regulator [Alphaproteobacteria bacterium]|nr:transcriptional regulator [Alphaproteobacteria bacterium]|tara:strand:+ start:4690 stop:5130 length:441 start_codon:yes stop_codon:yes gene_type:complete